MLTACIRTAIRYGTQQQLLFREDSQGRSAVPLDVAPRSDESMLSAAFDSTSTFNSSFNGMDIIVPSSSYSDVV